ncbi:hypothetical protein SO802_033604 [Lithocarpus litseifolius]|uniref:Secreted protein n=1 Tax=Lithocarpus litseifolius TaxID=425828 RepID=A0AAW2BH02_9ROSI
MALTMAALVIFFKWVMARSCVEVSVARAYIGFGFECGKDKHPFCAKRGGHEEEQRAHVHRAVPVPCFERIGGEDEVEEIG